MQRTAVQNSRVVRWPFARRGIEAAQPITPHFQASLERILKTTRFYLQLEERTSRELRRPSHSRR